MSFRAGLRQNEYFFFRQKILVNQSCIFKIHTDASTHLSNPSLFPRTICQAIIYVKSPQWLDIIFFKHISHRNLQDICLFRERTIASIHVAQYSKWYGLTDESQMMAGAKARAASKQHYSEELCCNEACDLLFFNQQFLKWSFAVSYQISIRYTLNNETS